MKTSAITQAVSALLLTADVLVKLQGFVIVKVALEQVFLQALQFPPANYHSTSTPYSSIIRSWYNKYILHHSTKGLKPLNTPTTKTKN
jgi:hypothetical protein